MKDTALVSVPWPKNALADDTIKARFATRISERIYKQIMAGILDEMTTAVEADHWTTYSMDYDFTINPEVINE